MADYTGWVWDATFLADVDFSTCGQHRFVKAASTQGYVALMTTAGGDPLGVLQNNPKAGDAAVVRLAGTTLLSFDSASAATVGGYVKTGSDGQGLGYANVSASVFAVGKALEALSSGSGVKVEVLLTDGFPG